MDHVPAAPGARDVAQATRPAIEITIHHQLEAVEAEWRRFERDADCTGFQAFDWIAAWCRHIGPLARTQPAIVVGRDDAGATLFILPLAVTPGMVRRLTWLGSDLCDYNGPLLAKACASRLTPARFLALWQEIRTRLQTDPRTRHDLIELTKMPERVGEQANPLLALAAGLNPSHAYVADLFGTWAEYYEAKRSSPTRRRDRSKLKRLGKIGAVRFVTPQDRGEIERSVNVLIEQKSRSFARMGVANMFDRPAGANSSPRSRLTSACAVSSMSAGSTSEPPGPRSISVSRSVAPTATCSQAMTTARRRGSGRGSRICAS